EHWERGLEEFPDNEYLLRRLFLLYHETEQAEKGVKYGARLVEINAWDYEYFGRMAHMLGQLNRLDEAISAAERALYINPAAYKIHSWLANAYSAQSNQDQSRKHRELYDAFTK